MLGRCALGVMQGRLLPKYRGRYQAHPVGYWQAEFEKAAALGLELIEFILDFDDVQRNPLVSDPRSIADVSRATGVAVKSVCADYFMVAPLQRVAASSDVLRRLIDAAAPIGVSEIVIPCVDDASLVHETDRNAFIAKMRELAPAATGVGVNLALETDLPPGDFVALLEEIDCGAVTVNYDTGNSASLGFDPLEEFTAYGERITDLHIKDRVHHGGSVMLGEGDCKFDAVFNWIERSGYSGPVIMQAWRDDEGFEVFRQQLAWLRERFHAITQANAA